MLLSCNAVSVMVVPVLYLQHCHAFHQGLRAPHNEEAQAAVGAESGAPERQLQIARPRSRARPTLRATIALTASRSFSDTAARYSDHKSIKIGGSFLYISGCGNA